MESFKDAKVGTFKSTGELVDFLIEGNEAYFKSSLANKTIEFIVYYRNGAFVCKKHKDSYPMNLTILVLKDYKKFYKTSKESIWYLNLKRDKPRICRHKNRLIFVNHYCDKANRLMYSYKGGLISFNIEDLSLVTPLDFEELKELFDGQVK